MKKLTVIAVLLGICLIITQLPLPQHYTVLAVDSHGDDINYIEVWEGDTLKANLNSNVRYYQMINMPRKGYKSITLKDSDYDYWHKYRNQRF